MQNYLYFLDGILNIFELLVVIYPSKVPKEYEEPIETGGIFMKENNKSLEVRSFRELADKDFEQIEPFIDMEKLSIS